MTRALYVPPAWFTPQQKRVHRLMNCPEGHETAMHQNDSFGHSYRRGYAQQDRRSYPYPRSSLAYAAYRAGCDYGLATRPFGDGK
jgi:hypothetical protein